MNYSPRQKVLRRGQKFLLVDLGPPMSQLVQEPPINFQKPHLRSFWHERTGGVHFPESILSQRGPESHLLTHWRDRKMGIFRLFYAYSNRLDHLGPKSTPKN